jgi:hypothetical protein
MTRDTFTIAAVAFLCIGAAQPVTFELPCECGDNRGKHRWSVKIDSSLLPKDAIAIQAVPLATSTVGLGRMCL